MWAGPTETTFLYPRIRFETIVTFGPFSSRCDWVKSGNRFWTCSIGAAGQCPDLVFLPPPRLLLLQKTGTGGGGRKIAFLVPTRVIHQAFWSRPAAAHSQKKR